MDDDLAGDDPENPDPADMDEDDSDDTEPCPHCGELLYEQAEFCPFCRQYISAEDAPNRKPPWIIIGVAVCLLIIILIWTMR